MKLKKIMGEIFMKNKNLELLNSLYQNTSMGISALTAIIPKTKDVKLKGELQAQLNNYHNQSEQIRQEIYANNAEPEDISEITKTTANIGITMSTLANKSSSKIAEMMIQGTNLGVIDINKLLNQYQSVEENVKNHANTILTSEQQYIDKLKSYL